MFCFVLFCFVLCGQLWEISGYNTISSVFLIENHWNYKKAKLFFCPLYSCLHWQFFYCTYNGCFLNFATKPLLHYRYQTKKRKHCDLSLIQVFDQNVRDFKNISTLFTSYSCQRRDLQEQLFIFEMKIIQGLCILSSLRLLLILNSLYTKPQKNWIRSTNMSDFSFSFF